MWISSPSAKWRALPAIRRLLVGEAADVYLDPALRLVVEGQMLETVDVEIAAELAVDPLQEVEVERGGHPGPVVVGGIQDLAAPSSDRRRSASRRPGPRMSRAVGKKRHGRIGLEIADRRAREKADPLAAPGRAAAAARKGRV